MRLRHLAIALCICEMMYLLQQCGNNLRKVLVFYIRTEIKIKACLGKVSSAPSFILNVQVSCVLIA